MRASTALLVMLLAAFGQAAEVKVPAEVKLKVGRLGKIEATATDPKQIRWINLSPDLDVIESETGRYATVLPVKAGTYKIALYSDAGGPPSYCVIVAGDPPPPVPPDPPIPPPLSALGKALKDAAAASPGTAAEKAAHMAALAALYRNAPAMLDKVKTAGQLMAVLLEARKPLVPDGAILPVRQVIAAELAKVLPSDPAAPYGDPARVKALFSAIEAALMEASR
jgi:hypothetical protein